MDSKQKEKVGDWLMDIAKYMITALVLSSVLIDMKNTWVLVTVIVFAGIVFSGGLYLVRDDKKEEVIKDNNIQKQ